MGMFELNNARVEIISPIYHYFVTLGQTAPALVQTDQAAFKLYSIINQSFGGVPPSAEGNGLFPIHSTINHSCRPNAAQMTMMDSVDAEVALVAKETINEGDEICTSYIDLGIAPDFSSRRALLRKGFGFDCVCDKCVSEQ
jgi:hypothetical protein